MARGRPYRFLELGQVVHRDLFLLRLPATHGRHGRQNRVWGKRVGRTIGSHRVRYGVAAEMEVGGSDGWASAWVATRSSYAA